jgi:hypothetical protein
MSVNNSPGPLDYIHLLRGCNSYIDNEGRDAMYRMATFLVSHFFERGDLPRTTEAIGVILLTWNRAFYLGGYMDYNKLEECLGKWNAKLRAYRERDIFTLRQDEENEIYELFGDFQSALYRLRKGKIELAPVSASKSLHIIAPNFFPLWDNKIAREYGFGWDTGAGNAPQSYFNFQQKTLEVANRMVNGIKEKMGIKSKEEVVKWLSLQHPIKDPPRTILKLIDEFNYAEYTLPKIRS